MRLTEIGFDEKTLEVGDLGQAIGAYEARDRTRMEIWLRHFGRKIGEMDQGMIGFCVV